MIQTLPGHAKNLWNQMYLILIQKEVKFKKQQKQQKIKLQIKLHGLSYEVLQVNQNLR